MSVDSGTVLFEWPTDNSRVHSSRYCRSALVSVQNSVFPLDQQERC